MQGGAASTRIRIRSCPFCLNRSLPHVFKITLIPILYLLLTLLLVLLLLLLLHRNPVCWPLQDLLKHSVFADGKYN